MPFQIANSKKILGPEMIRLQVRCPLQVPGRLLHIAALELLITAKKTIESTSYWSGVSQFAFLLGCRLPAQRGQIFGSVKVESMGRQSQARGSVQNAQCFGELLLPFLGRLSRYRGGQRFSHDEQQLITAFMDLLLFLRFLETARS